MTGEKERLKEEDIERYVSLRDDGVLVVESMFRKIAGADERRWISCVEDNIVNETIDYEGAVKDFYER